MTGVAVACWVWKDHLAADREQTENVIDRQIKTERRNSQHFVLGRNSKAHVDVADRHHRHAMFDHHTFGASC